MSKSLIIEQIKNNKITEPNLDAEVNFQDNELQELTDALKTNKTLQSLNLSRNATKTEEGAKMLLGALEHQSSTKQTRKKREDFIKKHKKLQFKVKAKTALDKPKTLSEKIKAVFEGYQAQLTRTAEQEAIMKFSKNFEELKKLALKNGIEESKISDGNILNQATTQESQQTVNTAIDLMINNYLNQTSGYYEADSNLLLGDIAISSSEFGA